MTTTRRIPLLHVLLGAWLGLTLATWAGAAASFILPARALAATAAPGSAATPAAAWRAALAATGQAAAVTRFQAAEFNRWMFATSTRGQVLLAALALALGAWPPRAPTRALTALALAALLASALALFVVPQATALGLQLAFEPRPLPAALAGTGAKMERLHALFSTTDIAKALLVAFAAWALARTDSLRASRR